MSEIAHCAGCGEAVLFEEEGFKPGNCTCEPDDKDLNLGDLFG